MAKIRYPKEILCLRSAKGHDYEADALPKRAASWGTRIDDTCIRCKSTRIRIIDSLGDISARWYEHSESYREVLSLNLSTNEQRLAMVKLMRTSN